MPESNGSCGDITFSEGGVGTLFEELFLDIDSGVLFRERFLFFLKLSKNLLCSVVNILWVHFVQIFPFIGLKLIQFNAFNWLDEIKTINTNQNLSSIMYLNLIPKNWRRWRHKLKIQCWEIFLVVQDVLYRPEFSLNKFSAGNTSPLYPVSKQRLQKWSRE